MGGPSGALLTLCLAGDVMTGRGIDQVLPHPGDWRLHEPSVRDARTYVQLAERLNGPIRYPVDASYIWGDALAELAHRRPHARIVNLETSITRSDEHWRGKEVHYRMHPDNVGCLSAAQIDCCVLANNHVLDYGVPGLLETLETLQAAGIRSAGAGRSLTEAWAPAVIDVRGIGRIVVFGFGTETSGILPGWGATPERPGVGLLRDLSDETLAQIAGVIRGVKRPRDVVVASLHWGSNWVSPFPRSTSGSRTVSFGSGWTSSTDIPRITCARSRCSRTGSSSTGAVTSSTTTRASPARRTSGTTSR